MAEMLSLPARMEPLSFRDTGTGSQLCTLTGHSKGVNVRLSLPDGRRVAAGSDDRSARIWSADLCASLSILTGHAESVRTVSFSLDGCRVVTGDDRRLAYGFTGLASCS